MVSIKQMALMVVMIVRLFLANAEISPPRQPRQCIQYTNVTENLDTENGIIETLLNSALLCTQKQPKNGWYRFKYRLNAPFSSNHIDSDSMAKFLGAPENISCSRDEVFKLPCRVHETITSKLCFEVRRESGNVRIGRSVNITNCGSFYVHQLFQFTCKDDTPTLQRWEVDKPLDNNCNVRHTDNFPSTTQKWSSSTIPSTTVKMSLTTPTSHHSTTRKTTDGLSNITPTLRHNHAGKTTVRLSNITPTLRQNTTRKTTGGLSNITPTLRHNHTGKTTDRLSNITPTLRHNHTRKTTDRLSSITPTLRHNHTGKTTDRLSNITPTLRHNHTRKTTDRLSNITPTLRHNTTRKTTDGLPNITPTLRHNTTRNTTVRLSNTTPMFHNNTIKKNTVRLLNTTPTLRHNTTRNTTIRLSNTTPTFRHNTTRKTTVRLSNTTPTFRSVTTRKAVDVFAELEKEIDELERKSNNNISEKEAQRFIERLLLFTNLDKMNDTERENGIEPQSINDTVRILKKIVHLNITAGSLNILGPANNILDGRNVKSWQNLANDTVINELITTSEIFAFQYADYLKNNPNASRNFTYENLQLHVKYIKQPSNVSMEERSFGFPNASFNLSSDALSKTSGTKVAVMWYKTIHLFISNSFKGPLKYGEVKSEIITASVSPTPEPKQFKEPVRMTWNIAETNHLEKCVYWKPEQSENKWKTDGCRRKKDKSNNHRLICECDHLTAFAVIDVSENLVDGREKQALELISTIGCSMSLVGIFLAILTYALLWRRLHQNTKSSIASQVLMHLCVAIGMTDIFAILAGPARNNETYCTAVSILLYFFILAVFGWMLCQGIVIYFQLVNVYSGLGLGGKYLKYFYLIGWGVPVVIVSVLVGANDRNDFITERACWCGAGGAIFWTFVATIGLILLINIVIFTLALRNALSSRHVAATSKLNTLEGSTTRTKASVDEILRKVRFGLRSSAVLIPLLGLTWLFGLLVFNRDTIVFKYLFAICNSLQGVMIFVFHVFFNRKVHEAFSRERKARSEARNYSKVMVSNNKITTLTTSESSPGKSSIPGTPTRARKSNYYGMKNIKNTIFKKDRNNSNWSKADNETYIEVAKV